MAKHTNTWKNVERIHAINHNAPGRIGPQGKDLPDWVSKVEAGESKLMDSIPAWIRGALGQSMLNCEHWLKLNPTIDAFERLPVVILHESGTPFTDDVVMIDHGFYLAWVLPALEAYWKEHADRIIKVRPNG